MNFNRKLKYTLCEDKLESFYEDLINLDDWIPFLITSNLPQDVFFKLGKNIENKQEYNNRLLKHKIENGKSGLSLDESLEREISVFLDKYPKFQPLFSVNE
ncbi:MAG: heat-shock protein [Methanobrevibacter sp.]|nr:heat-shock protein [Methanobrevibacter sp.]